MTILLEKEKYIVIDKLAGVVSEFGNFEELIPCHRLDKDTSGVMILARDMVTKDLIQDQFKRREVFKKYQALVYGDVLETTKKIFNSEGEFEIDAPIKRNRITKDKFSIDITGRDSKTKFKVVDRFNDTANNIYTLVDCYPSTGRTHQIRVHLGALGHAVAFDQIYGGDRLNLITKGELLRMFLHASEVKFKDPYTNEDIVVESKLPENLSTFLRNLKKI